MAPHSSTFAWKIPWMEETGGLQSMGSLRVGQDCATSLSLFTFMYWRRKWQPTPVFLPGESQGWGTLVGCRLWGCTESDTTEATQQQQQQHECESEVTQSCPTLCHPMDCSLLESSAHGISQARILEWVAVSFSREFSQPMDQTWVFHTVGRCFTI